MGLDNGVVVKAKIEIPNDNNWWNDNNTNETDIAYWRKFWGFRNEVVKHFCQEEECADIPINNDNVDELITILEKYLDRNYYEENGDSIWEYHEYLIYNIRILENLKVLSKYLKENPDTKCYFYDSY